ncbi:tryptophan synthase subunit alpha [Enterococcus italicus]|uniref:tryptophan synthase subunit alpha n=1 Tax=Enterococcus italicus TaxID=246144 RepID=UPI003FA1C5C2
MKPLTQFFLARKKAGQKSFVPYIMAGANCLEQLEAEIQMLTVTGATAIEIGVPFSDPVADGPDIQLAGIAARDHGTTLKKIIRQLQKIDSSVPLILMGYTNSFFHYGIETLVHDLAQTAVEGLIIPDLPYEHRQLILPVIATSNLALISLISLTSPLERIQQITKDAQGFVYAVTVNGTTGTGQTYRKTLDEHLKKITDLSPIPVLAGFGISNATHVQRFLNCCDGVVVGSTIVTSLQKNGIDETNKLVKELTRPLQQFHK